MTTSRVYEEDVGLEVVEHEEVIVVNEDASSSDPKSSESERVSSLVTLGNDYAKLRY